MKIYYNVLQFIVGNKHFTVYPMFKTYKILRIIAQLLQLFGKVYDGICKEVLTTLLKSVNVSEFITTAYMYLNQHKYIAHLALTGSEPHTSNLIW